MAEFPASAPSALAVFYRTYSRRKQDGTRENFKEAMTRCVDAIAKTGKFTELEKDLVLNEAINQHCFPSGRAFWVAGTDWAEQQKNFSGWYNCTSTNIVDVDAFKLIMELAMMGSGTGAILENDLIDKLPTVKNKINITKINKTGTVAKKNRKEYSTLEEKNGEFILTVGDSRNGWADAYRMVIGLAMELELQQGGSEVNLKICLGNVRPAGERLKGFGGTANPIKLEEMFAKVVSLLNKAQGRKLTSVEACLLIDEAAACVVAGNIRRSAGMRQFGEEDAEAANCKLGLYTQDENGNWRVDPEKEALRMANHTRCFHSTPSFETVEESIRQQFYSGEGAIQYVPEAVARANKDLLNDTHSKQTFLSSYAEDRETAKNYLAYRAEELGIEIDERELDHRMMRYGLNPCFAPGTIVMTRDGYQPIEKLVGKTVEVHDGKEWRTIDNFRVTANDQDVYDLELHDGTVITATEYHKFILTDGTRKELKDLKPGDELMAAKVEPVKGTIEAKGAYLKGFLIGDGTSNKGTGAICKVYAPKKVCLDRLISSQQELGMIFERRANGRDVGETGLTPSGYLKGLTATSEDLNPWCSEYKNEFPYQTLNWTDDAKYQFLAGLFDADGTARDGGTLEGIAYQITSISRPFLQGLGMLLRTLGIASKIGPARHGGLKDFGLKYGGIYEVKPTHRLSIAKAGSIKLAQNCSFERLKDFSDREIIKPSKLKSNHVKSISFSHNAPEVFCCTVPVSSAFTLGTLHLVGNCGEIIGSNFHCNLSEIHLNTISPADYKAQDQAFKAGALQVAALLHHEFYHERYRYSREIDPIVGVSFTGLFDFFVHAFGRNWLGWMMAGRPGGRIAKMYAQAEREYLTRWKSIVRATITEYCERHGIRVPNRMTTVQPAGTKSLLTGASSGWHPPKAQRFIRRITFGKTDPLVSALRDWGYNVIPAQSAKDEEGNLLDDIMDERVQEVLVEIPTEVSWANVPGCDQFDLSKLPAIAQWGLYMQVQTHYTEHNTSATIEFRENEIPVLASCIHSSMQQGTGYISAALLARFDANATFPRLPFEPIDRETYDRLNGVAESYRSVLPVILDKPDVEFLDVLKQYDTEDYELKGAAGCDSDKCLSESSKDADQVGQKI